MDKGHKEQHSNENATVRMMCLETDCIHHGLQDEGNDPGFYCNRKHIRISRHGVCADYVPMGDHPAKVLSV